MGRTPGNECRFVVISCDNAMMIILFWFDDDNTWLEPDHWFVDAIFCKQQHHSDPVTFNIFAMDRSAATDIGLDALGTASVECSHKMCFALFPSWWHLHYLIVLWNIMDDTHFLISIPRSRPPMGSLAQISKMTLPIHSQSLLDGESCRTGNNYLPSIDIRFVSLCSPCLSLDDSLQSFAYFTWNSMMTNYSGWFQHPVCTLSLFPLDPSCVSLILIIFSSHRSNNVTLSSMSSITVCIIVYSV